MHVDGGAGIGIVCGDGGGISCGIVGRAVEIVHGACAFQCANCCFGSYGECLVGSDMGYGDGVIVTAIAYFCNIGIGMECLYGGGDMGKV